MAANDDKHDADAARTRLVLLAVSLATVLLSVPWLGVGYCVFAGGAWCPVISLPTQVARDALPERETQTVERTPGVTRPSGASTPALVSTAGNLPTANPKYVALVMGNSAYASPNALTNPRNDAAAVATKLKALNYTLVGGGAQLDVGKIKFEELLLAFDEQAAEANVALIYYAGHGVEDRGENFLIPVDAKLDRRASLKAWGLPLSRVSAALPKGDEQYGLIILDACRTSNFLLVDDDGKQRSVGQRGLIVQKAPGRALIAYSASAGEAAADGDGVNSPYVESLLKHMSPDVDIKTVFARVQDDLRKSKWAQRPDTSDQLGDKKVAFAPEAPPPPVGTVFRDCAECLEMKVLSAGRFQMGDDKSDPEHDKTALPQHVVAVKKPFAIGTTPVTWSQWEACVKSGSCGQQRLEQYNKEEANYWSNRPVTNIDWRDARDYAIWLGRRTTKKYRLLSEAEFEYAARAGTTTAYWWGTKASHDYANYGTGYSGLIEGRDKWKFTSPVGSFPANPFGLYDMNGNVAQYVQDCLNPSYSGAPADGSAWEKELCDFHVLRGGGWDDGPRGIRSASRVRSGYEGGRRFVGFRVARTL